MKLWKSLYFQVLLGIVAGVLMGCFFPAAAIKMEPLGIAFVNAVKMLIAVSYTHLTLPTIYSV